MPSSMSFALILASVDLLQSVVIPVLVAALTAAAVMLITRAGEAANRRRDHYAQAVETLVAWVEFPYRIRRRTDDEAATLAVLAGLGHDLQERLSCQQTWIATECPSVARIYADTRKNIGVHVGAATKEAWALPPITEAAGMNLGDWGPGIACTPAIAAFQEQVESRFGYRRLVRLLRKQ